MSVYNQNDKILSNIVKAFEKRLKHKADLEIALDSTLGEFTGKIEGNKISAGSYSQLLDTLGRFLRDKNAQGTFTSAKKISGMYFCTHFNNYLDASPLEELYEYIDDLAFWGMNTFQFWFDMHHFHNMDEATDKVEKLKGLMRHVKSIGLKISMSLLVDEAFAGSPKELRADWKHDGKKYIYELNSHYHIEICPNKKGGIEKIVEYRRQMLEAFRDTAPDYVNLEGYDQGGCSCDECYPWGSNGMIKCTNAVTEVIREYFPNVKFIYMMWQFGTFTGNDIEFEMTEKAINNGTLKNIEYYMSECEYARYPFEHKMSRPIIGFPEISMGMANPWGGYGATPRPKHFQALWDRDGDKLDGGFPYSEGLYEDINKVIMLRLYRDNQRAEDTIKEYLAYEFDLKGEMLDLAYKAVMAMEDTLERDYVVPVTRTQDGIWVMNDAKAVVHRYEIKNKENISMIEEAVKKVNDSLSDEMKNKKKWKMIYLRAMIDGELSRNDYYRNDKVMGYFHEIVETANLQHAGFHTIPDIFTEEDTGKVTGENHVKA